MNPIRDDENHFGWSEEGDVVEDPTVNNMDEDVVKDGSKCEKYKSDNGLGPVGSDTEDGETPTTRMSRKMVGYIYTSRPDRKP